MNRFVRPRAVAAAATLGAVLLGACGQPPSGVAVVVNGQEVLDADLEVVLANIRANLQAQGIAPEAQLATLRTTQNDNLSVLIRNAILRQEAERRGITVSLERAEELWQQQVIAFGSLEEILARIDELGWTEQIARQQIVAGEYERLLQEQFREAIVVTDEDVQTLYDSYGPQWLTRGLSHIQLATEAEAEEVLALLIADPSRWDELASARSLDTETGPIGGALGQRPRDGLPPELDDAVWSSPLGGFVGPFPSDAGFHILRVEDENLTTLDEVADQLRVELVGQLFQTQYGSFESDLFVNADVVVDSRFGEWDPSTVSVVFQSPLDK